MGLQIMTNIFEEWDSVYDKKIKTKVIADSYLDYDDVRVTSLLLHIPRIILPEETRHRVYSFSIDSSRARSTETKAASVWKNPFVPQLPLAEHKGMQGYEFLDDETFKKCQTLWYLAMQDMVSYAEEMNSLGLSHQYTNRLLEPFMYIDVLVTGTTWDNYLTLRTAHDAQFEIQVSARQIQNLLKSSKPKQLNLGQFHLPFITEQDELNLSVYEQCLVSVARCARTSYIDPVNSNHSIKANISLAKKLMRDFHLSPFEHIVQNIHLENNLSGNLCGGAQLRKILEKINFEELKTWIEMFS